MTGSTFRHYRIEEQLGTGGMGTVYRATDVRLGRAVALKFLNAELLTRSDAVDRFRREARAISSLNHPNICVLFDIDEFDEKPCLVMEYLEGTTVADRLRRKPFPAPDLVDVAIQVADALDTAHAHGLIHRDIKPSNIFLTSRSQAKVLDFGIAKMRERPSSVTSQTQSDRLSTATSTVLEDLTKEGSIRGTLPYMSPEQIRGDPVDTRSDVFSLGATLYEMATGRRAFPGRTPTEIAASVLERQPAPPKEVAPQLPEAVNVIILTALEKDRNTRYQSAAEMRAALLRAKREFTSTPVPVRSVPPRSNTGKRRGVLIAATLLCTVLACGWLYRYLHPIKHPRFQRMEMSRLTSGGNAVSAALSPDGKFLAYAISQGGKQSFRIRQMANSSEVQVSAPEAAEYRGLTFSPDGNLVYYNTGFAELYRVPTLGGKPTLISKNITGKVSFSPDGKRFAFFRRYPANKEYTVFVANADGTGERKIASRQHPNYYMSGVAWSPDGKTIVCTAGVFASAGQYTSLVAIPAEGGPEKMFTDKKWYLAFAPAWLTHGTGLVAQGAEQAFGPVQIWYIPYPGGAAERITNDLNSYNGISMTADSTAFATVQLERISNIWIADESAKAAPVQITSGGARLDGFTGMSWTPDGRIVYASRAGGDADIWIMQADGSGARQLTEDSGVNAQPRASPDGRYIVFTSDRQSNKPHIWRMDMSGENPRRLTDGDGEHVPDCCIDGKWVVYSGLGGSGTKLWRVPLEGGSPEPIIEMVAAAPIISPNSELVAFNYFGAKGPLTRGVAVVRSHDGHVLVRLDVNNIDPSDAHVGFRPMAWSRDSRALLFLRDREGVSNIWRQPIDGGSPEQVTRFEAGRIFWFTVSGVGNQLAVAKGSVASDVILIRNVD
jgi:eukaryotic-like serine/threonine-protein kinase